MRAVPVLSSFFWALTLALACAQEPPFAGSATTGEDAGSSTLAPEPTSEAPITGSEPGTSASPDPPSTTGDGSSTGVDTTCGDAVLDPGEGCDNGASNGPHAA